MAEAFTAGVRPGGLTDDTQIRMLLCYLVKVAGPVKRETMQGALLQEQLVNYFEFADALAEVNPQYARRVQLENLLRQSLYTRYDSLCRYDRSAGSKVYEYFTLCCEVDELTAAMRLSLIHI